ncbi:MAG: TetR/AcrR family transcriptional regulator [Candidatus Symbiothrix sp.]|jgi:AcrR family transcriptional regulator|nr:TetR/AcrR family transcriptional regulator [Candidatus Symbiothrix sp.]
MKLHTIDVKDRILNVARELFIANGYNGTSIRDIAAASDTNLAHIKYYFQSKYSLFEIIFEEAFDILVERIFSIVQSDMPFFDLVEAWINAYYEILPEYPQIPIFIINEVNHNPEQLTEMIKKRIPQQIFNQLSNRLEEEHRKGIIKETTAIDFGLNVVSLCVFPFICGKLIIKVADISSEEYLALLEQHKEFVIRFILDALKP